MSEESSTSFSNIITGLGLTNVTHYFMGIDFNIQSSALKDAVTINTYNENKLFRKDDDILINLPDYGMFLVIPRDTPVDLDLYLKGFIEKITILSIFKYYPMLGWTTVKSLPTNVPNSKLINEWRKKLDVREKFAKKDIDVKYSIVLHGKPGTGKTTFASQIARLAHTDLYIADNCNNLCTKKGVVILIEELDKFLNDDGEFIESAKAAVVYEYLDGSTRPQNSIILITCNNIDKITKNKILSRPGRIDEYIEFTDVTEIECQQICSVFYDDCDYTQLWNTIKDKAYTVASVSSYVKYCAIRETPFTEMVAGSDTMVGMFD